jgi:radical SAM superfamily enzyme YgiQ (UPF0313 family)
MVPQSSDIVLAAINAKWIHPSLALRLLKANLGILKDRCLILEFALRQNEQEKIEAVINARPRILGLSVSIWNHKATVDLLKALYLKWREFPRPWVILGGPEVSWLPEDAEIFRCADYVIRGEGEDTFRELCMRLLENGYSENKAVPESVAQFIQARPPDISGLASPYYLYTDDDLSRKLIYVESSRGCAFNCDFCLSALDKGKVREFPLELFLGDMEKLLKRLSAQKQTIKFLDRSFNLNPARAVEIAKLFLDRIKGENKNLCIHFEIVPFYFTPELRDVLSHFPAGSLRLELGIQTLNPGTALTINRAANTEGALEVLAFLREKTNAIVHADLIAGLPGEDIASFGKGFDRLWLTMASSKGSAYGSPMEIQLGILKLLPGTPMDRHTESFGMTYAAEPPYEVIESSAIPLKEMNRIKNFARFWEILVNRNHFPNEISRHVPPGVPVFWRFMELSERLLGRFGRNWGIDREELRKALVDI